MTVEFTVAGVACLGLNGGTAFKHNEAFSFQIATDDQAETDRLWHAIVGNGGQESACGWCRTNGACRGRSRRAPLTEAIADPDPAAAKRAFEAMMTMGKIDIAAIEAARAVDAPDTPPAIGAAPARPAGLRQQPQPGPLHEFLIADRRPRLGAGAVGLPVHPRAPGGGVVHDL